MVENEIQTLRKLGIEWKISNLSEEHVLGEPKIQKNEYISLHSFILQKKEERKEMSQQVKIFLGNNKLMLPNERSQTEKTLYYGIWKRPDYRDRGGNHIFFPLKYFYLAHICWGY